MGREPCAIGGGTRLRAAGGSGARYDGRVSEANAQNVNAAADDTPEQVKVRSQKRARLMEEGTPAYPVALPITSTIAEVRQRYAHLEAGEETEDLVGIAGRVVLMRNGGKLCFATLMDGAGEKIQVMLSAASVGAVVSKPTARNTTCFAGLSAAIASASSGE